MSFLLWRAPGCSTATGHYLDRGRIQLASAVYRAGIHRHTHIDTHTQKKRKKRQKVRGRERGVNMYCTTAALLYNIHYIKSLSGSWKKEKRCVNRGDTVFSRF